jgi:dynein heavy chain
MYQYDIEEDVRKEVDGLMAQWEQLLEYADKQDFAVNDFKKNFAEVTKQDVETFKAKIKEEFEQYNIKGPGVSSVNLDEGLELLNSSKDKIKTFNKIREENVLAEKLFNLPISKFPELISMEEGNKKYDLIYGIYKDFLNQQKDFSVMSWSKLDPVQLLASADKFEKNVKKLLGKHPTFETVHPFVKLRTTIVGFKESLPLIESLKQPFINERHWKRIMEETGKDLGEINLKTLTLSKVFELELQNCEDKVNEIVIEAKAEAQNEENIAKIDQAWRVTNFNIVAYKKGGELKGYAMTSPEEIR